MYLGSTSVTQWSGADQQIRKLDAERDSRVVEIEPD
jgi:hypothetical protein